MRLDSIAESARYEEKLKKFPIPVLKNLPAAVGFSLMCIMLSGCHSSTSVEASTSRVPVVAPAGTVLRVRLDQTLDSWRSRPGDRFSGVLDAPVVVGANEVLAKGTAVEGHVQSARESGRYGENALLVVTLDSFERDGRRYALATSPVARTAHTGLNSKDARILLPAESIMGFTLTSTLTA